MSPIRVRVVVPDAVDRPATTALLRFTEALAATSLDVDVLVWSTGPLVPAFAAVAPTVDAGEIDRWRPARALQFAGQHRLAQGVKTPRLRTLLARLPSADVTWLGGLGAAPYLAWVPAPDHLVVQVGAEDVDGLFADDDRARAAVARADVVVVTDTEADAWLGGRQDDAGKVERHALLPASSTEGVTAAVRPFDLVGLLGFERGQAAELVTALALANAGRSLGFRWLSADSADWALWQGRGGPVTHHVEVVDPAEELPAVQGLRVLVHPVGRSPSTETRRLASILGVEVVAVDDPADAGPAVRASLDGPVADRPSWTLTVPEAISRLVPRIEAVADGSAGDAAPPAAGPAAGR